MFHLKRFGIISAAIMTLYSSSVMAVKINENNPEESSAQYKGKILWDAASYATNTALAWNINYCGIKIAEEALAYTAYGIGTLGAGPAVGSGAYYATKGAFNVGRYLVPGFEGYIAGALAPVAKTSVVDPIINNYGPSVIKGVTKVGIEGIKCIANGLSSLYNYNYKFAPISIGNAIESTYSYQLSKAVNASIVPFYSK